VKNVIITGASGMVGNIILDHCLSSSGMNKVTSLVRKKSNNTHPKLKEVVVEDFTDYSNYKNLLKNIDSAFSALEFTQVVFRINYSRKFRQTML
jgi:putative NADH-flavin reductase